MKNLLNILLLLLLIECKSSVNRESQLPSIDLLLLDSITHFNISKLKEGSPTVLIYFSPDCEHCQKETELILANIDKFKNVQFYFVTNDPLDRLKVFNYYYKIPKYRNITLGVDEQYSFIRYFKGAYPPYIVVFDSMKRQSAAYQGSISLETLIASTNGK